jgi:hypothetical protein
MVMRYLASVLFLACSVGACDPTLDITGSARTSSGTPIAEAKVSMRCPKRAFMNRATTTKADGTFRIPVSVGCADRECTIELQIPTGQHHTYVLGDYCRRSHRLACGKACNEADIQAVF